MIKKELGKISSVHFGLGGYQDAMLGLHLCFEGSGWGVCTNIDAWDVNKNKWSEHCKWTEGDRSQSYDEIMRKLSDYLKEAKVQHVEQLKNIPVEVTFESNTIKSWRILTEVL